jgi:hypothetical protein
VQTSTSQNGITELTGDRVKVQTCRGEVVFVTQEFIEGFRIFAMLAQAVMRVYGPPDRPDIWSLDGSRPATDPRGPLSLQISVIRLTWPSVPNYMLGYSEVGGDTQSFETLARRGHPCASAADYISRAYNFPY